MEPIIIDAATARALATQASCDPRTIMKILRGERVKYMVGRRAEKVLIKAGYLVPSQSKP